MTPLMHVLIYVGFFLWFYAGYKIGKTKNI